jgi:hypothetical protein
VGAVNQTAFAHLAIGAPQPHIARMTDASRKYAIHSAPDGKFYLLYGRKAVQGHEAVASTTYPSRENPRAFDSAGDVISFAKETLDATDEDFAEHPGDA